MAKSFWWQGDIVILCGSPKVAVACGWEPDSCYPIADNSWSHSKCLEADGFVGSFITKLVWGKNWSHSQCPCWEVVGCATPPPPGVSLAEHHYSSSPPFPAQAVKRVEYLFTAGWAERASEKLVLGFLNSEPSAPVVSAPTTLLWCPSSNVRVFTLDMSLSMYTSTVHS